ncbi:hypothetical protein AURDEDRAFT_167672 [Auricularia subglabra TFB-10046 SS5]|nr:hypothetical protein AURDEDRAFT_167672 [Auricularia subglabra TFB-10046 SS5]
MLRAADRGGARHDRRSGLAHAMGSARYRRGAGLDDDERGRALGGGRGGERDAACGQTQLRPAPSHFIPIAMFMTAADGKHRPTPSA